MKIGILQTGHSPKEIMGETGNYADLFVKLLDGQGFDFVTYSVVDMQFPTGADAADGWLITGSKHGAYEDHPFIAPLEDLIREIYAADLPLVGICFGHQIIAQALGGKVEKYDGGWAIGRQYYTIDGVDMALNAWHQDQVVTLPEGAQVIGSNAFCTNAAMLIDDTILTIQPHPEFSAEFIDGLIKYRGGALPSALVDTARKALTTPTQSDAFVEMMVSHLDKQLAEANHD